MKQIEALKQLEEGLTNRIEQFDSTAMAGKDPADAYKQGLEHGRQLVRELIGQQQAATQDRGLKSPGEKSAEAKKLHHYPPEQVARMDLSDPGFIAENMICNADMIEAAFHFENQLLELLGDDNTIPFEAYEGLATEKLAEIIKNCTEKINRLSNKK